MIEFSSLNPYESLEVLVADSPQELVTMLKTIRTPIKIVNIVSYGSKQVAYIMGDVRPNEVKRAKLKGVK